MAKAKVRDIENALNNMHCKSRRQMHDVKEYLKALKRDKELTAKEFRMYSEAMSNRCKLTEYGCKVRITGGERRQLPPQYTITATCSGRR